MTLVLVPRGRGRWSPITVTITGRRAGPMLFRRGDLFPLGGAIFRISAIRA